MKPPTFLSDENEAKMAVLAGAFYREARELLPEGALNQPPELIPQTHIAFCFQSIIGASMDGDNSLVGAMQGIGIAIGAILANIPDAAGRQALVTIIQMAANHAIEANGVIHETVGNA